MPIKKNINFFKQQLKLNCSSKYFFALTILLLSVKFVVAQKPVANQLYKKANPKEFVISYGITVEGAKKKAFQQTYNGGLKTVFVKNDLVRIRLVSLMRMQSIYFNNKKWVKTNIASLVKESGSYKSILSFNTKQWKQFNSRNDSVRCDIFKEDTLTILNKLCNKAILTFKDSTKLTVYYLPNAKSNTLANAEPIFSTIPGLVMKYIYENKSKSITYTAVDFKIAPISNTVFVTPKKGYQRVKYNPNGVVIEVSEDEDDDIEGEGDEDDNTKPSIKPTETTTPKSGK